MSSTINDGRLLINTRSLSGVAKSLQRKDPRFNGKGHSKTLDSLARQLGFASYNEANQELTPRAAYPENLHRTPSWRIESELLSGGISAAAKKTLSLSKIPVSSLTKLAGNDKNDNPWYLLTHEAATSHRLLNSQIALLHFNIFNTEMMPGFGPYYEPNFELDWHDEKGNPGYLVPAISLLDALDLILARNRCSRPWRITDYHGHTDNSAYFTDRQATGLYLNISSRSVSAESVQQLKYFISKYSINITSLVGLHDQLNDLIDSNFNLSENMNVESFFNPVFEFEKQIEAFYTSAFKDAVVFFEGVRYLSWVYRTIVNCPSLFTCLPWRDIGLDSAEYLQQIAQYFGGNLSQPFLDRVFCPPNALTYSRSELGEGYALKVKRGNKPIGKDVLLPSQE